jgi:hypothetical protein
VSLVEPAKRESVAYEDDALDIILRETDGYPFFLQVWGSHIWEVAPSSPFKSDQRDIKQTPYTLIIE